MKIFSILFAALLMSLWACGGATTEQDQEPAEQETIAPPAENTLTAEEAAAGWKLLFDGKHL